MNKIQVRNKQWHAANTEELFWMERKRPFMLLRPQVYPDGNSWCALYGENIQKGVAGFGDTPELAAQQFDVEWLNARLLKPNKPHNSKSKTIDSCE